MTNVWLLAVGLGAGVLSGIFGIGGGIVIVPLLVLGLGFPQSRASGISLVALLLPVGALGVWQYYKEGKIGPEHVQGGLLIALGLFVGAYFGARLAVQLPEVMLKRGFAVLLVVVAFRMWPWGK